MNFAFNLSNPLKVAKNIVDFYIRSNLHVGLAAGCLTWITLYERGFSNVNTLIFVITSTVLSYNFIRLKRQNELEFSYQNWMEKNRNPIWFISLICALIVLGLSFQIKSSAFLILIPSVVITFFYGSRISKNSRLTLRDLAGIKIVTIALVWALVTVLFPLLQEQSSFDKNTWITFAQRFLFVFAITIPFDIRDLHIDQKEMKTLPLIFGTQFSKYVGFGALFFFVWLEFGKTKDQQDLPVTLLMAIISSVFLYKSKTDNHTYFASFWVEAIPIIWVLLLLLFRS